MTTTKQSTFGATIRTTILLATLTGLLVVIGAAIGGPETALTFLFIGLLLNLGSYFFSDKLALKMSRAKPLEESEAPRIYQIVRELTTRAGLPMPRLYLIPQEQPNAFATGRNPKHAAVAVTEGITKLLSEDELRGVLAHELAHVQHRDILIQSVAAAIGGAITYIAYMPLSGSAVTTTRRSARSPRWPWSCWPRSRPRSSSSRSRASASTPPTPAAPKSAATRSRWRAPCCVSSRERRRSR